ncbi:hypothetical protein [Cycloclasticus zancles]|jgi:hypothetical protein|uniref:hypothetical protein n=1 Tax=Cycloclasticus zancles TaxID=1329899 RepID=UPI0005A50DC4|nr:hypothetical protein [Cycloclasticus zancles]MDF1828720.1 hypothetical protein [Cycloclasticus pugetii]
MPNTSFSKIACSYTQQGLYRFLIVKKQLKDNKNTKANQHITVAGKPCPVKYRSHGIDGVASLI